MNASPLKQGRPHGGAIAATFELLDSGASESEWIDLEGFSRFSVDVEGLEMGIAVELRACNKIDRPGGDYWGHAYGKSITEDGIVSYPGSIRWLRARQVNYTGDQKLKVAVVLHAQG